MNKERYCYVIHSSSKSHTTTPRFVHRNEAGTGFSSLYAVTEESAKAIIAAGTTAGFKGVVWSERLWIDVDSYEAADATERRLREMGYDFVAYDSGGRGVHFGVLRISPPSHLLPTQDREWTKTHFPEADTSIYTHLHLFRLPGTVHETGGREKSLVLSVPGNSLIHPKFERKAYVTGRNSLSNAPSTSNRSIFDCFRVMSNTKPTKIGDRHPTLVKLVYALKDDAGVSSDVARWWIGEANKMSEEPKDEEQLDQIVRSIYG